MANGDTLPPLPPEIAAAIKQANEIQEVIIQYNPANKQLQFKAPTDRLMAYGMLMFGIEALISASPLLNRGKVIT